MPNSVRCKFVCDSKREFSQLQGKIYYDYQFHAVYTGSEENNRFFAFTPGGQLNVSTVLDGSFAVGKEYYLDLTIAE